MEDKEVRKEITRFVAQIIGLILAYIGLGYSATQFFGQKGWYVALFVFCLFYIINTYYTEIS